MAKHLSIPFEALKHFREEVSKVVQTVPEVKEFRVGGYTLAGQKRGEIWVRVDKLEFDGPVKVEKWLAMWGEVKRRIVAAVEPVVATFGTLKLPGVRVPRVTYTLDVDAIVGAFGGMR